MDQFTFCAVHRNKSIQMIDNEKKNADYEKNVEEEKILEVFNTPAVMAIAPMRKVDKNALGYTRPKTRMRKRGK